VQEKYLSARKVKINSNGAHFIISDDYMGPYFMRNVGITLRDYVKAYRKSIVKQRVASGLHSLKGIAAEFELTDESHVSKILRSL